MIYLNNRDNSCRFALGEDGANILHVIGVNPSTADDIKSDQTIRKIKKFSVLNKFDGYLVFNLCPIRSTDPDKLPFKVNKKADDNNIATIVKYISVQKASSIWCAWGNTISKRDYLIRSLERIYKSTVMHKPSWYRMGAPTNSGNPRHPSRLGYKSKMNIFDIKNYITSQ